MNKECKNLHYFDNIGELEGKYPELTLVEFDKKAKQKRDLNNKLQIDVTEQASNLEIVENILNHKSRVLFHKDCSNFINNIKLAAQIEVNKMSYFEKPEDVLFSKPGTVINILLQSNSDKGKALTAIDEFCSSLKSSFLTESVNAVFEELFMNAVLDAPREAGSPGEARTAEIFLGDDGENLFVSCLDRFGSLEPDVFFNRIFLVEKYGSGQVINLDRTKGGAGIGSSILYGCSNTLIVGVVPKRYTRVTCVIPRNTNRRKFAELKKNIHLLVA